MRVKDLLEVLNTMDRNAIVVLQKDAEGNGHSPLRGAYEAAYVAESTWSGEVYDIAEDEGSSCDDEVAIGEDGAVLAVVLHPVN